MYIVLVGGFWAVSRKEFGRQVDPDSEAKDKLVDYIIQIEGLPESFLAPEEIVTNYTYYCETCQRKVPEWEIERREGCGLHNPTRKGINREVFRNGVYNKYNIPKKAWMSNGYRIWMSNEQGLEKWRQIWRYIERIYPAHKIVPLPKRVGTMREWNIEKEEVPLIDLFVPTKETSTPPPLIGIPDVVVEKKLHTKSNKAKKEEIFKCSQCDKEFFKPSTFALHLWTKHKIKYSEFKKKNEGK